MSSNCTLVNRPNEYGFMCEFIEESTEKPPDWLNGESIVHYKQGCKEYQMIVNIVNGKREGEANLIYEGLVYLRLMYTEGSLTGMVERVNDYGIVDMRGQLVNGRETGLFKEYDMEGSNVWTGYYRNGKRFSEVVISENWDGYFDEKSVANNSLLSIAQYDDCLRDKNGRCFECEDNSIRSECVFENGVKKHTIREFVDEKMIVYDANGNQVYEGKWFGNMKSGYLCHESMEDMQGFFKEVDSNGQLISVSEYDGLNAFKNGKCFELENERVKRVCFYENGYMKRVVTEFSDSIMIEYDDGGKKVYEGEFKGDMKNGFVRNGKGTEYLSSQSGKESSTLLGTWSNGKKDGEMYEISEDGNMKQIGVYENDIRIRVMKEFHDTIMIEYDESSNIVYEGEFKGDVNAGFVRNGKGYLLAPNASISLCLFEDGHIVRYLQEFDGDTMKEYDDNGRVAYFGGFTGDMKKGFVKHGMGYLMDDSFPRQYSLYDNGSILRLLQEFSGETMTEYDENGKRQYTGGYKGSIQSGFLREGKGREFTSAHGLAVYSGEWKEGKREGFGTEFSGLKPVYIGEWKRGMKNGKGKEMDSKGTVVKSGVWSNGTWKTGWRVDCDNDEERELRSQFQGVKGRFIEIYEDSSVSSKEIRVFIGFVDENREKVAGRVYSNDKFNSLLYEGRFENNQYSKGTLYMDQQYTFTGEFANGKMKKGKLQLDNHVLYEGEVNEFGEMDGKGVLNTVDKNPVKLIDGSFKNNKAHGFARVYYPNGSLKYCGHFKEGVMDGTGVLFGENYAWMVGYQSMNCDRIEDMAKMLDSERGETTLESTKYFPMWENGDFWSKPVTVVTDHGAYNVLFEKNMPAKLIGGMYGKEWQITGEAGCLVDEGETYSPHSVDIGMMHVLLNGEVVMKYGQYEATCTFEKGDLKHCKLFMNGQSYLDSDCSKDSKKVVAGLNWIVPHGEGKLYLYKNYPIEVTFENGMIKRVKSIHVQIGEKWYLYSGTLADGYYWTNSIKTISGRGSLMYEDKTPLYEGDIRNNVYHGEGKLITYQKEKSTNRVIVDKVHEGTFENGEFKSGRVTDYMSHQDGWNCVVTQNLMIDKISYRLVCGKKGDKLYYDKLVSGTDVESGLFAMGNFICWGTKRASGLDGSSHWYAYSANDLESIFTTKPVSIKDRVAGLKLVKEQKHENEKLVFISVTDPSGVETRFYPDKQEGDMMIGTGDRRKGATILYEGGMKQRMDTNGNPLDEFVADGKGQSWSAEGIYDGQWKDGMKSGDGQLTKPDRSAILGRWKNDKLEGKATVIAASGKSVTKMFKNGEDLGYCEFVVGDEKFMLVDKTMELEVTKGDQTLYKGQVISIEDAIAMLEELSKPKGWLGRMSEEEKRYCSILEWIKQGARWNNTTGFRLPYHSSQFIPHGKGFAYYQQSKYEGEFLCGVYHGEGMEWSNNALLYDGSWAFGKHHGEGFAVLVLGGPLYSCVFDYGQVKQIDGYYLDTELIFEGSFNQYNPYRGTFYVSVCGHKLKGSIKKGFSSGTYSLKGDDASYSGSVEMNGYRFVLGYGTLTIGQRSFTGLLNELGDCESCTVEENGHIVFEGWIKGLKYYVGKHYCYGKKRSYSENGDEEGFFENDELVDGYRKIGNEKVKVNGAIRDDKYLRKERSDGLDSRDQKDVIVGGDLNSGFSKNDQNGNGIKTRVGKDLPAPPSHFTGSAITNTKQDKIGEVSKTNGTVGTQSSSSYTGNGGVDDLSDRQASVQKQYDNQQYHNDDQSRTQHVHSDDQCRNDTNVNIQIIHQRQRKQIG